VVRIVLVVTLGAFALGEVQQSLRWRRGASRVDVRGELLFRVAFLAGILLLPAGRALLPVATVGGPWLFAPGVVVAWAGLLLRWWSFVTLGRYFTVVVQTTGDQPVVERGPYRVLRHPSYTGLLLAFAGCGLMLGNWAGAAAAVAVVTVAVVGRIRREERALLGALGARYRDFAARRARLIPRVW
jgi:protein-S-isoprenylcysteine O-methyltransferase Ste14